MSDSWKRNLSVPFFSQRENTTIWKFRAPTEEYQHNGIGTKYKKNDVVEGVASIETWKMSCNVTCLAMLLHFLGVTKDTPDQIMEKVYAIGDSYSDANFDRYLKYAKDAYKPSPHIFEYECILNVDILKTIAEEIYGVPFALSTSYDTERKKVKKYTLDDVKAEIAAGFPVIVSCGIAASKPAHNGHYVVIRGFTNDGDVIINDPWGKATDDDGDIPVKAAGVHTEPEYDEYQASDEGFLRNNDENNGENIVIRIADFKRQMLVEDGIHKYYVALILYDRRWSFPFSSPSYKLDWEAEGDKFVLNEESKEIHYALESPVVHFPLTNTCTPHLGAHLTTGSITEIQSIGSGQVIAAKLRLRADEDTSSDSNCMLLVRHQIKIAGTGTDAIKIVFVLYMHLNPNPGEISIASFAQYSSMNKTSYSFVNEMLEKRNHRDGARIREKLNALIAGEVVILNDFPNLFLELREGDFIGYTGLKGFYERNARRVLHLEIFSETNIFQGTEKFELDLSTVAHLSRKEVFEAVKDKMFDSYRDKIFRYNWNAISETELKRYFEDEASHVARAMQVIAKPVWNDKRDFLEEWANSKGINGFLLGLAKEVDESEFVEHNINRYLWWNSDITTALDGLTASSAVCYYHPIHFLHWLMTNDENCMLERIELKKQWGVEDT